MPRLFNKITLSFLAALVILFSFGTFFEAKAQSDQTEDTTNSSINSTSENGWYNQNFFQWYSKVYDTNNQNEIFGERYTAAQVQWVFYGTISYVINSLLDMVFPGRGSSVFSCILENPIAIGPCMLLADISSQSPIATINTSTSTSLLSLVFADRPLSGIGYIKDRVDNFAIVPVAHAQSSSPGFGFDSLLPIQPMWTATRNIAFGIFVIAAVVFSFMIMFRVKISPQVAITVQSAIPKLIIALLLVTFSYAIAGLLVDLMYVVIGIFSTIMPQFLPGGGR